MMTSLGLGDLGMGKLRHLYLKKFRWLVSSHSTPSLIECLFSALCGFELVTFTA